MYSFISFKSFPQKYFFSSCFLVMWLLQYFSYIPPAKADTKSLTSPTIDLLASRDVVKGKEITINNQKFPVAWYRWQEGDRSYLGISDTAAMQVLGLELLNTTNPQVQPVRWFGESSSLKLKATFQNPYRYIDIGPIVAKAGWKAEDRGNSLQINTPTAKIINITRTKQTWGEQTTVELDRGTTWQISQNGKQGAISLNATADPALVAQFQPRTNNNTTAPTNEDDLGDGANNATRSQNISLTSNANSSKILLDYPAGNGIRVFSLDNPPRLLIENRRDSLVSRDIQWHKDIRWRQRYVNVSNSQFPVVYLEIDLAAGKFLLKPITTNTNTLTGTAPLLTTARQQQASIAINGGYFNRNNQLPLGAIKKDDRWLSSPILNRGAIAWDDRGRVKIDRLTLQDVLISENNSRIPLVSLNSGYVQAGIARYDKMWGRTYTTLTDNEKLFVVEDNLVVEEIPADKAGETSVSIPNNGYVLTARGSGVNTTALSFGATLKLESRTIPADFQQYSQIIGAGPLLLTNGRIVVDAVFEKFNKAFGEQTASRSAIGVTSGGKLIIAATHNRAGGKGATLNELAQIMQNIGAVSALNLDGGSSTSLYLGGQLIDRSPVTAAKVHNGLGLFNTTE
jgi:exopolysaccharide biosynthesis protein